MPTKLRKLDDRVLGDRLKGGPDDDAHADGDPVDHPDGPRADPADARPAEGARTERTDRPRRSETTERTETTERDGGRRSGTGDGAREALAVFVRISRIVLFLLAAVVIIGVLFALLPTNEDNSVVDLVTRVSDSAAGPFRDVFEFDGENTSLAANHGLAAAVYLLAASLLTRLPGLKR